MHLETEEDIQRLIDERIPESYILEYKKEPWPEKKGKNTATEIAKDISSFANTQGGRIIIGVEENKKTKEPVAKHPFEIANWEERIEDVRHDTIKPFIEELRIWRVKSDEQGGKAYLIIEIPESPNAPHMVTTSNKYYRRDNSGAKPMSEAEVRQLYERKYEQEKKLEELYRNVLEKLEEEKAKVKDDDAQLFCLFLPRIFEEERFAFYDKDFKTSLTDILQESGFHPHFSRKEKFVHCWYGDSETYSRLENIWIHPCGGTLVILPRLSYPHHNGVVPKDLPLYIEKAFRFAGALFSCSYQGMLELKITIYLVGVGKWYIRNFLLYYPERWKKFMATQSSPLHYWYDQPRNGEPNVIIKRNVSLWELKQNNLQQFLKKHVFKAMLRKLEAVGE